MVTMTRKSFCPEQFIKKKERSQVKLEESQQGGGMNGEEMKGIRIRHAGGHRNLKYSRMLHYI